MGKLKPDFSGHHFIREFTPPAQHQFRSDKLGDSGSFLIVVMLPPVVFLVGVAHDTM
jgi:hypothetical protein